MNRTLFAAGLLLVRVVRNVAVWEKESLLASGQTVYLRLAPVDPRSLMQGDYMRLRYEIAGSVRDDVPARGALVLTLSPQRVGTLARIHATEALAANECLLRYKRTGARVTIGSESFFFQEGHADVYAHARYGMLKVAPSGEAILVGLCDDNLHALGAPPTH